MVQTDFFLILQKKLKFKIAGKMRRGVTGRVDLKYL